MKIERDYKAECAAWRKDFISLQKTHSKQDAAWARLVASYQAKAKIAERELAEARAEAAEQGKRAVELFDISVSLQKRLGQQETDHRAELKRKDEALASLKFVPAWLYKVNTATGDCSFHLEPNEVPKNMGNGLLCFTEAAALAQGGKEST